MHHERTLLDSLLRQPVTPGPRGDDELRHMTNHRLTCRRTTFPWQILLHSGTTTTLSPACNFFFNYSLASCSFGSISKWTCICRTTQLHVDIGRAGIYVCFYPVDVLAGVDAVTRRETIGRAVVSLDDPIATCQRCRRYSMCLFQSITSDSRQDDQVAVSDELVVAVAGPSTPAVGSHDAVEVVELHCWPDADSRT